jgi:ADP-ribose pyrophosphatase YjhB (NUDIX family)
MMNDKESEKDYLDDQQAAKDLVLEDYEYFAESFWKNEQTGETRINFFVGLVTVVLGALAALIAKESSSFSEPVRLIALGSLTALLVLGLPTLARMLTRNENTDGYKKSMDTIRQIFKDQFDPQGVLLHYYPFGHPHIKNENGSLKKEEKRARKKERRKSWWWVFYKREIRPRKFGGLAHTVALINCLLLAGLVAVALYPIPFDERKLLLVYTLSITSFILGLLAQLSYVTTREKRAGERLRRGTYTHSGGVVYKLENGIAYYLLVAPRDAKDEWLLPKGHIESGEGHGEAALREVHEETGAFVRLLCPVDSIRFTTEKERVFVKFYLMEWLNEGAASEDRRKAWFTFEKALESLTFPEHKDVLRASERKRLSLCGK